MDDDALFKKADLAKYKPPRWKCLVRGSFADHSKPFKPGEEQVLKPIRLVLYAANSKNRLSPAPEQVTLEERPAADLKNVTIPTTRGLAKVRFPGILDSRTRTHPFGPRPCKLRKKPVLLNTVLPVMAPSTRRMPWSRIADLALIPGICGANQRHVPDSRSLIHPSQDPRTLL